MAPVRGTVEEQQADAVALVTEEIVAHAGAKRFRLPLSAGQHGRAACLACEFPSRADIGADPDAVEEAHTLSLALRARRLTRPATGRLYTGVTLRRFGFRGRSRCAAAAKRATISARSRSPGTTASTFCSAASLRMSMSALYSSRSFCTYAGRSLSGFSWILLK